LDEYRSAMHRWYPRTNRILSQSVNTFLHSLHQHQSLRFHAEGSYKSELNPTNPIGYGGNIASAYATVVSGLFSTATSSAFAPREFKKAISHGNPRFAGYSPQDAQEFIAFLLDALHEDLNRIIRKPYLEIPEINDAQANDPSAILELGEKCWEVFKARNNSIITDLCYSMFKSTLKCPVCSKISISFEPISMITLTCHVDNVSRSASMVGAKARDEQTRTLEELFLESFNQEVILSELDPWHCPKCKKYQQAISTREIWSAPKILIIHLHRFNRSRAMVHIPVDYPVNGLDISNWVSLKENEPREYDLFAVVKYIEGSNGIGHYIALVKSFSNGKWFEYNGS
jgi:ubiquitin C-terminal hydrolase